MHCLILLLAFGLEASSCSSLALHPNDAFGFRFANAASPERLQNSKVTLTVRTQKKSFFVRGSTWDATPLSFVSHMSIVVHLLLLLLQ